MRHLLISAAVMALAACAPAGEPVETDTAAEAVAAETAAAPAETPAVEYGAAGTYLMDPGHASLVWRVNHLGLSMYTARFTSFDAKLVFDPSDVSANSVEVMIDPLSVETEFDGDYKGTHTDSPYNSFNEDLGKRPTWFNGLEHPQITFKSTSATQTSGNTGTVTGDLTFLGVTKPVTLDVTYNGMVQLPWTPDQDRIGFSAVTTLKRSDFGMDTNLEFIGDEVEVIIEAEFLEEAAPEAPVAE